jgi:hypothetical protein
MGFHVSIFCIFVLIWFLFVVAGPSIPNTDPLILTLLLVAILSFAYLPVRIRLIGRPRKWWMGLGQLVATVVGSLGVFAGLLMLLMSGQPLGIAYGVYSHVLVAGIIISAVCYCIGYMLIERCRSHDSQ